MKKQNLFVAAATAPGRERTKKQKIVRNLHDNCIKTELNEIEEDNNDGDAVSLKKKWQN